MTTDIPKTILTEKCGHHCGVLTTGGSVKHVGHCSCGECHGDAAIATLVEEIAEPDPKESISE